MNGNTVTDGYVPCDRRGEMTLEPKKVVVQLMAGPSHNFLGNARSFSPHCLQITPIVSF